MTERLEVAVIIVNYRSAELTLRALGSLAKERGRAVLVVTHDGRLDRFADRVVHVEDGRVLDAPVLDRGGPRWTASDAGL